MATVLATIGSPVNGVVIPLADVPDPVLNKGVVRLGVGVGPTDDTVYAPGASEAIVAQSTGHAFGLLLDQAATGQVSFGSPLITVAAR